MARVPGATGHWAEPSRSVWHGGYDLIARDRPPDPDGHPLWADGMVIEVREVVSRPQYAAHPEGPFALAVRVGSPVLRFRMRYVPPTWGWVADPLHGEQPREGGSGG